MLTFPHAASFHRGDHSKTVPPTHYLRWCSLLTVPSHPLFCYMCRPGLGQMQSAPPTRSSAVIRSRELILELHSTRVKSCYGKRGKSSQATETRCGSTTTLLPSPSWYLKELDIWKLLSGQLPLAVLLGACGDFGELPVVFRVQ